MRKPTSWLLTLIIQLLWLTSYSQANSASPQACASCHQSQHQAWSQSDHAKAMAKASPSNVLGDFTQPTLKHHGQHATFREKDGQYSVTIGYDDTETTYSIDYVFGHYPLQQYLVQTEAGRYHVLPFAWDSRTADDGGQRWFHIYPDEEIKPADRLHWRQPLQNWNGMCADCHSDGLKRQYNVATDTFDTQWDNINVGCQSCHGTMDKHAETMENHTPASSSPGFTGQWIRKPDEDIAQWIGPERDNTFMDTCFACHSLRSPLTDGMDNNSQQQTAFLDQFTPTLLASPLYHADGQIKEEVYVYGSFLQSKMYEAGVNCLDCHDKHTMKLKLPQQEVCLQCHSPSTYDVKAHHGHEPESAGSQCVDCHMPTNTYMVVDDRRDHSFKIPKPHLSQALDSPNACTQCHQDKDNQWAATAISSWHGKPDAPSQAEQTFWQLQVNGGAPWVQHLALIEDTSQSAIVRATAIEYLSQVPVTGNIPTVHFKQWLSHDEPLIRLAATRVAQHLPLTQRVELLTPLLKADHLAIKTAAANQLLGAELPSDAKVDFKRAYEALIESHETSSWRGEGRLNHGMLSMANADYKTAEDKFKSAIFIDPYFTAAYINLADLYRNNGHPEQEHKILMQGLQALPKDPLLHYSHGLYLVRAKQYQAAIKAFKAAVGIAPNNSQYAYLYWLSMDNIGQTRQALMQIKQYLKRYNYDVQLVELGLHFAQKSNDANSYQWLMQYYPRG